MSQSLSSELPPSGSWAVRKRYGVAASCSWQPHVPLFAHEETLQRQGRLTGQVDSPEPTSNALVFVQGAAEKRG
jgi:hypothetical protein